VLGLQRDEDGVPAAAALGLGAAERIAEGLLLRSKARLSVSAIAIAANSL
jgi:hypothetical protein